MAQRVLGARQRPEREGSGAARVVFLAVLLGGGLVAATWPRHQGGPLKPYLRRGDEPPPARRRAQPAFEAGGGRASPRDPRCGHAQHTRGHVRVLGTAAERLAGCPPPPDEAERGLAERR